MILKKFLQSASNLFAENRLLKFSVVVLTIGYILLSREVSNSKGNIRTVVVPPHLNSKVEIYGSWTTESYIREYMRYLGALIWNYSPATVRGQFDESLASWHPSVFEAAKERLYILAGQIEQTRASSVFYITGIKNNPDNHYVEVTGNSILFMQDKSVESVTKSYFVLYKVEAGRFWILGIEEKAGKGSRPIGLSSNNVGADGKGDEKNVKP